MSKTNRVSYRESVGTIEEQVSIEDARMMGLSFRDIDQPDYDELDNGFDRD